MLKHDPTILGSFRAVSFARFSFDSCRPFRPPAEKLNIVILYERLLHVGKAVATYLHLIRELPGEFSPDFRLWRIDLALEPVFKAEAERDLADAAVIIVAVNGRQACPPEFQRWRKGVGHGGGPPPHAIIALMGASREAVPEAGSWSMLLDGVATQIHPEVFVCEPAAGRTRRSFAGEVR